MARHGRKTCSRKSAKWLKSAEAFWLKNCSTSRSTMGVARKAQHLDGGCRENSLSYGQGRRDDNDRRVRVLSRARFATHEPRSASFHLPMAAGPVR